MPPAPSRSAAPTSAADAAPPLPDDGILYELAYYPDVAPDQLLLDFLTTLVDPFAREGRVLDCACGTGEPMLWLADRYSMCLSDASADMLRVTQAKVHQRGLNGVTVRRAEWTALPDVFHEPFDAVLCTGNALARSLTLRARREALDGMCSVMRPGGLLYLDFREDFEELPTGRSSLTEVAGPVEWEGLELAVLIHETRVAPHVRRTKDLYLTEPGRVSLQRTVTSEYLSFSRSEILADLLATGFGEPTFHARPGRWPMAAITAIRSA
ncbi:class I SAM-dependent methyltransferase [Longimicrobium sp.]|uniref:class I SAM-dependent methyltransferase n=1 Tax=Longimicrobium sp. TaxID=2029185 RepID=UPI002E3291EC|nr:class I SAM-dependent methyltransferase [Longimicrobium sp.]HEX6040933.1 class I SAM-dependent methyltransferase [Longimicrobium sp.]